MRELKIKKYIESKDIKFLGSTEKPIMTHIIAYNPELEPICEYIGLVDQNGQDIYTNDLIIIENNISIPKQFRVVFNKEQLAFGFQTEDEAKKFYTLREIRGIYKNFTITKVGNIFLQGG